MNKIALGTAQFGSDYGINNKTGKVQKRDAFEILSYAAAHGVKMLDTAPAYGDSENVLGEYLRTRTDGFKVVSKLPAGAKSASIFEGSLKRLCLNSLYGYLVHDLNSFLKRPEIWSDLTRYRENGYVRKIGFSLYYPGDIEILHNLNIMPDLVQVPFNVFDQRFASVFPALKHQGIEIHVRSVFLQGLVFKKPEELLGRFSKIKTKSEALHSLSEKRGVSISSLCLSVVLTNPFVDKAVIGVDNLNNLKENLDDLEQSRVSHSVYPELAHFREEDENILLPFLWNKK